MEEKTFRSWECYSCGERHTGTPAAEISAEATLHPRRIPAIIADEVEMDQSIEADVCGDCVADLTPFIYISINFNGGDVIDTIDQTVTVNE